MSWYITVLKKYALFSGRAQRAEYWMFLLFNMIAIIIFSIIDSVLVLEIVPGVGILYVVYTLAVLIPSLAVSVRRLHDTARSGWFFLIGFIPIVGAVWLLVLFVLDGTPGENQYGPNPKVATG